MNVFVHENHGCMNESPTPRPLYSQAALPCPGPWPSQAMSLGTMEITLQDLLNATEEDKQLIMSISPGTQPDPEQFAALLRVRGVGICSAQGLGQAYGACVASHALVSDAGEASSSAAPTASKANPDDNNTEAWVFYFNSDLTPI